MRRDCPDLSIVTCAYNEQKNIGKFLSDLEKSLAQINPQIFVELIIVDDGSSDNTWTEILQGCDHLIMRKHLKLKITCIKLISNFGQMQALEAGLQKSSGRFVLTMDSDLQTPASYIPAFWLARDNQAIVVGQQVRRQENKIKAIFSTTYYKVLQRISSYEITINSGDFRLYPRNFVSELLKINNNFKVYRFLAPRIGLPIKVLRFNSEKRLHGKSSYSFKKMFILAKNSMINLSVTPVKLVTYYLTFFLLFFLGNSIFVIYSYLTQRIVPGWTSVSLTISLGFIGVFISLYSVIQYLIKTLEVTQNFPAYVIQQIDEFIQ